MSLKSLSVSAPASSVGVVGALVRDASGAPKALHLSLPRISMFNRRARRWLRARVNEHVAAAGDVPVFYHRVLRDGTMTNEKGWLAWL